MLTKKQKYENKNRGFKTEWKEEFVFVERNNYKDYVIIQNNQIKYVVLEDRILLKVS
jgi:hypothetical protein